MLLVTARGLLDATGGEQPVPGQPDVGNHDKISCRGSLSQMSWFPQLKQAVIDIIKGIVGTGGKALETSSGLFELGVLERHPLRLLRVFWIKHL